MKPFRFGLEKVLALRVLETLRALQALGAAQAAVSEAADALRRVRAEQTEFGVALAERRSRGMPAWEWSYTSQGLASLQEAEVAAVEQLRQAQETEAARRTDLREAKQREETLSKLRERQREAHEYDMLRAEQALTDELAQSMRLTPRRVDLR